MSSVAELKAKLQLLHAQRCALEIEAEAIRSELSSPGINGEPAPGLKDPLGDSCYLLFSTFLTQQILLSS